MPTPAPAAPAKRKVRHRSLLPANALVSHRQPARSRLLDIGRSALALRASNHSLEDVARLLGVTDSTVCDCQRLLEDTAPAVLAAVEAGTLAATTAVMLARAVPDRAKQSAFLEQAKRKARRAGVRRISAKHFPLTFGSRRRTQQAAAVASFIQLLDTLPTTAASNERRQAAKWVACFLDGTCTAAELQSYLSRPAAT